MMGDSEMGAYGTPEHLPPQQPLGQAEYYDPLYQSETVLLWVCRHCGTKYRGKYCPNCGTKAGKKHPNQLTWKITLFLLALGWVLGMCIWVIIIIWPDLMKFLTR